MRRAWLRVVGVVAVVSLCGGAGTEAKGQYSRRTPIVEAVQKTRASIVSVKAEKKGSWGRKETGGTGVIVDERGFVVTNSHVVASADRVTVHLADGSELAATIVTEDAHHDLAVLRLSTTRKLQALAFGTSSDLMVGETVIAVGHPFGFTNTVSTGIVSGLGREVTMPNGEVLRNLIQTNASINPGNSGGPLLNINGELIGINVAIREGAQGIAFALSADDVQQALSKHLSSREDRRRQPRAERGRADPGRGRPAAPAGGRAGRDRGRRQRRPAARRRRAPRRRPGRLQPPRRRARRLGPQGRREGGRQGDPRGQGGVARPHAGQGPRGRAPRGEEGRVRRRRRPRSTAGAVHFGPPRTPKK